MLYKLAKANNCDQWCAMLVNVVKISSECESVRKGYDLSNVIT